VNKGLGMSRGIGHAAVRLECAATEDRPAGHYLGSVVATGDEFREMVLQDKAGLGVLFTTVPGRLERADELESTFEERYRTGRVAWLRMGISSQTCHALLDYADEVEARGIGDRYGFVRPLHQEGAGCSAFSMAFLQLAGLVEPDMRREWTFDVRVPMPLIGGEHNPDNRVPVLRLLFISRRWADPDEPHLHLTGWDPHYMFHSIRHRARLARKSGDEDVEQRGRALGLVVDRRDVVATEALRDGSFFAGEPEPTSPERFLTTVP